MEKEVRLGKASKFQQLLLKMHKMPVKLSAWSTIWTYEASFWTGACTWNVVDPMNLYFSGHAYYNDVDYRLMHDVSPAWKVAWIGGNQCAWTGSSDPGTLQISDLRIQTYQMEQGDWNSERHHMRIWGGGQNDPEAGEWSVGSTHHERYIGGDHCVDSYEGSENFVKSQLTGKWFSLFGNNDLHWGNNQYYKTGCDGGIQSDGYTRHIGLTVDT